jgi:hypothetical protein
LQQKFFFFKNPNPKKKKKKKRETKIKSKSNQIGAKERHSGEQRELQRNGERVSVDPRGACAVGPTGPEGEMEQEREGGERRRKEDKEMQSGDNVGDKRKEGMSCCEKKKKKKLTCHLPRCHIWEKYGLFIVL